jgi:hypothetical protein
MYMVRLYTTMNFNKALAFICLIGFSLNSFLIPTSVCCKNALKKYTGRSISFKNRLKSKDSLVYGSYTLKFETIYLEDSVSYEERHLFNPVVVSQRMIFLKDGVVVKIKQNLCKKILQKVSGGGKLLMLSNVYYNAYVVIGKYKTAYAVCGSGGCNACSETLDFYTLSGTKIHQDNSPNGWSHFLKEYGIANYNKSNNEIFIYPPTHY